MTIPSDFINLTDLPDSDYESELAIAVESSDISEPTKKLLLSKIASSSQVNNLHAKRDAIEWSSGLKVDDPLQLYTYENKEYLPNKDSVPFTTGATFNSDNWVLSEIVTSSELNKSTHNIDQFFVPGMTVSGLLQAAIDYSSSTKSKVILNNVKYNLEESLIIKSNMHLVGSSQTQLNITVNLPIFTKLGTETDFVIDTMRLTSNGTPNATMGGGIRSSIKNSWLARFQLRNVFFTDNLSYNIDDSILAASFYRCSFSFSGIVESIKCGDLTEQYLQNLVIFTECTFRSIGLDTISVKSVIKATRGYGWLFSGCEIYPTGLESFLSANSTLGITFNNQTWIDIKRQLKGSVGDVCKWVVKCDEETKDLPTSVIAFKDIHLQLTLVERALVGFDRPTGDQYITKVNLDNIIDSSELTKPVFYVTDDIRTGSLNDARSFSYKDIFTSRTIQIDGATVSPTSSRIRNYNYSNYTFGDHLLANNAEATSFVSSSIADADNVVNRWNWESGTGKFLSYSLRSKSGKYDWTFADYAIYSAATRYVNLGTPTHKFDNLYINNPVGTLSDERFKTKINNLSDAELATAKAITVGTFKYLDRVSEKGDNARIHFGFGAQSVIAAFAANGLDALDYACVRVVNIENEETGAIDSHYEVVMSEILALKVAYYDEMFK